MSDKVEYSRLLIKRSDNAGIIPTIPTGSTLSTFTDTDTFVGEFFLNSTDDRLWVRTDNGQFEIMMSGNTSGNTQNLGQTLIYGNQTLGNDIVMSQDDRITSYSGNSYIEFNKITDEQLKLYSTNIGGDNTVVDVTPLELSMSHQSSGGTLGMFSIDSNTLDLSFTDLTETSTLSMTPSVFTLQTSFGNIQSTLDLDPEQSNNGTQLKSQDIVNNNFGLVLVRESDVLINVDNPVSSKSSSLAITDTNTQMISELYFQGYNGVGFWTKNETTTSTGATPIDIVSIDTGMAPFGNNKIYKIICHYTGINNLYTSGYTTEVRGTYRNNGGTLTQIGALEYFSTRNEFVGLTNPDIYVSGDNIRGRVRGITSVDITWSVIMMIHQYG
jgi:hypothetical protein